jgi:hypothetical protein
MVGEKVMKDVLGPRRSGKSDGKRFLAALWEVVVVMRRFSTWTGKKVLVDV